LTVLGIDPGSQYMGFGAVRVEAGHIGLLSCGVIAPPLKLSFNERIGIIASELDILIAKLAPDVVVIERVFLGKNADSAFKLGHARGVAVAAAIRSSAKVAEYAARAVKKGITGSGASSKEQVQTVLLSALGLKGRTQADASDALALAFYHARNLEVSEAIAKQSRRLRNQEAQP
jgi:crossover junction endodeoxyribonuclease RuvC